MGFGLKLIGFDKLKDIFAPTKVPVRLRKHVGKATDLNAQLGASAVIRAIQAGVPPANSPLTVILKGSSRTLVDSGALAGSIVGKGVAWDEGHIGALRKKRTKKVSKKVAGAKYTTDIAALLYFGATIQVTDKMRRLFFALSHSKKYKGKIKPLSQKTKVIVIPPRRYLDAALTPQMEQRYKDNWLDAVERTLRGED
jgi:hypothetical protein